MQPEKAFKDTQFLKYEINYVQKKLSHVECKHIPPFEIPVDICHEMNMSILKLYLQKNFVKEEAEQMGIRFLDKEDSTSYNLFYKNINLGKIKQLSQFESGYNVVGVYLLYFPSTVIKNFK